MQRVQALTFFGLLSTTMVAFWMFGRNSRFVDFLEKLTLRPNWTVLPQIAHCATVSSSLWINQHRRNLIFGLDKATFTQPDTNRDLNKFRWLGPVFMETTLLTEPNLCEQARFPKTCLRSEHL